MKPKALILAAGLGSRFGASTRHTNKCLHRVGNRPLLLDIIQKFIHCGVDDIYVVAGHQAAKVNRAVQYCGGGESKVRVLINPRYASTSILDSFLVAEPLLNGESFIFTTGDHYFDQSVLEKCLQPTDGIRFLKQVKQAYMREDSKIGITDSGGTYFGKDIPVEQAVGEFGGMALFSRAASSLFFDKAKERIKNPAQSQYVMSVFNDLIQNAQVQFESATVSESSRTEIDHVQDLRWARALYSSHSQ
ncbi:NTP transferase domain-containing protein [Motiliproteus sp. MSK22-1]|uniref:phosphocholine cytidylyltransferase family protein n=1 Tax=Motiliproteus sp. MSK22-1 TaxID=1897630 RepID=UPI0009758E9C|nr:NTP transferase domain-containing protein [Motiliproteus sp. MSK22-1]OMH30394.1 hypothetical protein BGP75_18635 [Motiliproteus sp. MSK22-1]